MLRTIVVNISNFVCRLLDPYRTEFATCCCWGCEDARYYQMRGILRFPEEHTEAEVEAAKEEIAR